MMNQLACKLGDYRDFTGEIRFGGTHGFVKNASFQLVRNDGRNGIIWHEGTWLDGTFDNGAWFGGDWNKGTWHFGVWKTGTWHDGTWVNGIWHGGAWLDGTWKHGVEMHRRTGKA